MLTGDTGQLACASSKAPRARVCPVEATRLLPWAIKEPGLPSCRLRISGLLFPSALHLILSGFPEIVGVLSFWGDELGLDDVGLVPNPCIQKDKELAFAWWWVFQSN